MGRNKKGDDPDNGGRRHRAADQAIRAAVFIGKADAS